MAPKDSAESGGPMTIAAVATLKNWTDITAVSVCGEVAAGAQAAKDATVILLWSGTRELAVREIVVEVSVSVIAAPATTAFDGSVTEPETVPDDADCDHTGRALPTHATNSRTRTDLKLRVYIASSDQKIECRD